MIFDKYTKWEVLSVYYFDSSSYCVQVRMNKRTGFKKFKVTKINRYSYELVTNLENINHKTNINE